MWWFGLLKQAASLLQAVCAIYPWNSSRGTAVPIAVPPSPLLYLVPTSRLPCRSASPVHALHKLPVSLHLNGNSHVPFALLPRAQAQLCSMLHKLDEHANTSCVLEERVREQPLVTRPYTVTGRAMGGWGGA